MLTLAALYGIALIYLAFEVKVAPVLPDMDAQGRFDASERQHHADALAVILPLHANASAQKGQRDHV